MRVARSCAICGEPFEATRRDARYCGAVCRKAAWRGVPRVERPASLPGRIERETRSILAQLGVDLESEDVARAALRCAAALDDPATPPGALVSLTRALPETLAHLREAHETDPEPPWMETSR